MTSDDKLSIEDVKQYVDWETFPTDILENNIFPFVGMNQYRFVGGVCRVFEKAYRTLFSVQTAINVSSVEHAKICFDELPLSMKLSLQDSLCASAARNGNLVVLKWARYSECPWDAKVCSLAANNGDLEMLQWANANGCPWDETTCSAAALNGHLEVLQWAVDHGCHWNEITCANAALNGHLELLQWAHFRGCHWDEETCTSAARNGHLEVLQWARSKDCPWDYWTLSFARDNGHCDVYKWAVENKCPYTTYNSSRFAVDESFINLLRDANFFENFNWDEHNE